MIECLDVLPSSLTEIKNPPKKLFYKGDISLLNKKIVAIVGSRRPNAYTKNLVKSLASELSKRDIFVVSGAAMGVDALAHLGSFPKTIGVMANSLDFIYPKVNEELIKKMEKECLVISEYEPSMRATKWSFVQRNRIVVGLSSAVVIAQADEKSGSMRSAEFALQEKKPLFVLPQRLHESKGTNRLLSDGKAKLISDIEEFADMFGKVQKNDDEVLEFCKNEPSLEKCLAKFGDLIYEYELDGKISIEGLMVRIGS